MHRGQVLVHDSVADEFRDALIAEVEKLKTGDPMDPETDVGPVINHDAFERISAVGGRGGAGGGRGRPAASRGSLLHADGARGDQG